MSNPKPEKARFLSASYHKLEFRPPKTFKDGFDLEALIIACFNVNLGDFESKSLASQAKARVGEPAPKQYKETMTFNRLIDLEHINSTTHSRSLNRITIQGMGLDTLNLDLGRVLTVMKEQGFVVTEAHSKILLPKSVVAFETIEKHFLAKAFTSSAKIVIPEVNPQKGNATTWSVGKRPNSRSANTMHGKRVIFYEAGKVHPELPKGTVEMELQLFGDAAQKFVYGETRDVDLTVRTIGIIRGHLSIKTLTGDRNISRRKPAKWWDGIVGGVDAVYLPRLNKPAPKLDNQVKYLHQALYQRKQALGEEILLDAMGSFCAELGLAEKLLEVLKSRYVF